jgi:hypothetical protein
MARRARNPPAMCVQNSPQHGRCFKLAPTRGSQREHNQSGESRDANESVSLLEMHTSSIRAPQSEDNLKK